MTLPLPTKCTYLLAFSLVSGLLVAWNLETLLQFLSDSEADSVSSENPVVLQLPESEMLPPEPLVPEPESLPEPVKESVQPTVESLVSEEKEKPPAEPAEEESEEVAPVEIEIAEQLPAREAAEFKKRVEEGIWVKKTEKTCPGFRAEMEEGLIDKLLKKGLIRLAITNGSACYLFEGQFGNPGKSQFALSEDLRGFSERGMRLRPGLARRFMSKVPPDVVAGARNWWPVILMKRELDYMVLSAQNRMARQKGIPFEEVRSTSGKFQLLDDLPFEYTIEKIDRKKPPSAGKAPLKKLKNNERNN